MKLFNQRTKKRRRLDTQSVVGEPGEQPTNQKEATTGNAGSRYPIQFSKKKLDSSSCIRGQPCSGYRRIQH